MVLLQNSNNIIEKTITMPEFFIPNRTSLFFIKMMFVSYSHYD